MRALEDAREARWRVGPWCAWHGTRAAWCGCRGPIPLGVPEPGAPASDEHAVLRPFRSYAGRWQSAGEAIASTYAPSSGVIRWRIPRGEWARAYREAHALYARSRRETREQTPRAERCKG